MLKDTNEIIRIDGEPNEVFEIRCRILESFGDLEFQEDGHKYFLNGKQLPSVSQVVHQFETPFDQDTIAEKYAQDHGETKEYWIREWKFNNLKATTTGTLVHEYGESLGWLRNGHPEKITNYCKSKYVAEEGWLIPTRDKENAVLKFHDEMSKDLHFVLAETKVYTGKNKELTNLKQDYCGTFDILYYYKDPVDDNKSGLVIMDYKTNKELKKEFNRKYGKTFLAPFDDFIDEPLSTYTLQLNAYQIPLEDIGLKVLYRVIIWLKDDGTYERIPIPNMTERLRNTL